jgi:hypothetical protein
MCVRSRQMSTLAHHALLAHLQSGQPIDFHDPVVQDQIYSVKMTRKSHTDRVRKLRADIMTKKSLAHKNANFRTMQSVNYYLIDKITADISTQLFDNFIWECIETPIQVAWKEYFHSLYELLVVDRTDHVGNIIMTLEILKYHEVLDEPLCEPNPKDVVIFTLKRLFEDLKREQRKAAELIGDVRVQMNHALSMSVHVQLDLHAMYREVRMLSKELETLNQILEKIRVDEHSDL